MLTKFKLTLGAALIAASQLAAADTAEVKLTGVNLGISGGEWWYWLPGLDDQGNWPTWLNQVGSSSVTSSVTAPKLEMSMVGWQGQPLDANVTNGTSQATSWVRGLSEGALNGASGQASVSVSNGQTGSANAMLFNSPIMVGGNATFTVTGLLDHISVNGTNLAQANAYIELCGTLNSGGSILKDKDSCEPAGYAEAFVDTSWSQYTGPNTLTATWTNPGATTYVWLTIGLTASANSIATPVPEPSTAALWLAGLLGAGALARRRRQH